ncbi:DUF4430 domain-containing protein [uncultured Draconibacterium sp.]|uniref:DUF4430 domain-containing protein n=1 Tax=uncultured Draconibacterium sp. TaxID=1573823 RepID=UPI0029C740B9|nr:DUF4430 domain-containing protein [uncultured Draconibacterium sp.]
MNKKKIFCLNLLLACFIGLSAFASNGEKVTVEIDFGAGNHPKLKIETNWKEGLSALEALQFVAEVKTHPVGQYVFVDEIDGVKGEPNQSVWYYKINDVPAKKIAIDQPLENGDKITWIYKQDVCSPDKDK